VSALWSFIGDHTFSVPIITYVQDRCPKRSLRPDCVDDAPKKPREEAALGRWCCQQVGQRDGRVRTRRYRIGDAARIEPAVQPKREDHFVQLRVRVDRRGAVANFARHDVIVYLSVAVRKAAHVHDAHDQTAPEQREEPRSELEVAQVVGHELHVEPVRCLLERDGHDAGDVHGQVQLLVLLRELLAERGDACEDSHAQLHGAHAIVRWGRAGGVLDVLGRFLALCIVAACEHLGTVARQLERRHAADTRVGARDDRKLAGQRHHLLGDPLGRHFIGRDIHPVSTLHVRRVGLVWVA
jgi:hypothetical protein